MAEVNYGQIYDKDKDGKLTLANVLLPSVYNSEQYKQFYQQHYASTGNTFSRNIESITDDIIDIYGFNAELDKPLVQTILKTLPTYFFVSDFINNVDLRPLFKAYEGKYVIQDLGDNMLPDATTEITSSNFVDKITNEFKDTYETELEGSSETRLKNPSGWTPYAKTTNGGKEPGSLTDTPGLPLDNGNVRDLEDKYAYTFKELLDTYTSENIEYLIRLQDSASDIIPTANTKVFSQSQFDSLTGKVFVKSYTSPFGQYEQYNESKIAGETGGEMRGGVNVSYNLRNAVQYISKAPDKELRGLQNMLKMGGFYKNEKNTQMKYGVVDDLTQDAWQAFLTAALQSELSPGDFAKKNRDDLKKSLDSGEFVPKYSDTLMESMADQWGTQMLGRELNANETKSLAAAVRQWDIQNNKDIFYNNPMDGSSVDDEVYSYLQKQYNDEIGMNNMKQTRLAEKEVWG